MTPTTSGRWLALGAGAALLAGASVGAAAADAPADAAMPLCFADASPPEYYAFPLVPTRQVQGTASSSGRAEVHFGTTAFGVSVAPDGSYRYELRLRLRKLPEARDGAYVAWVTTPTLDEIRRLGTVGPDGAIEGTVTWNKFLVVVTLEEKTRATGSGGDAADGGVTGERWSGPIVMRGMSRSGMMHTMAGHGPFQQENCAAYGFDG